jgi:hypothetical protein
MQEVARAQQFCVIKPHHFDANTAQVPGMQRVVTVSKRLTGSQELWTEFTVVVGSKREKWSDFRATSDQSARRASSSTIDGLRSCSPSCFFHQHFVHWHANGGEQNCKF